MPKHDAAKESLATANSVRGREIHPVSNGVEYGHREVTEVVRFAYVTIEAEVEELSGNAKGDTLE